MKPLSSAVMVYKHCCCSRDFGSTGEGGREKALCFFADRSDRLVGCFAPEWLCNLSRFVMDVGSGTCAPFSSPGGGVRRARGAGHGGAVHGLRDARPQSHVRRRGGEKGRVLQLVLFLASLAQHYCGHRCISRLAGLLSSAGLSLGVFSLLLAPGDKTLP